MSNKPGGIIVTHEDVYTYYAEKCLNARNKAIAYVEAWSAKVEPGTRMTLAKMKCTLADGPCGCPEDSTLLACKGPYPGVPIEIILQVIRDVEIPDVMLVGVDLPRNVLKLA